MVKSKFHNVELPVAEIEGAEGGSVNTDDKKN